MLKMWLRFSTFLRLMFQLILGFTKEKPTKVERAGNMIISAAVVRSR